MQSIYLTCIRPALEYASVAWCGVGTSDADRLEQIQRAAARLIADVSAAKHMPQALLLVRWLVSPLPSPFLALWCLWFFS